jgi:two-component system sensor histidine kinase UhpB
MKLNQYLGRRISALALALLSIFLAVAITQATISIQREKKGTEQLLLLSQELDQLSQTGLSDLTPKLNKLIALSQSDEFRHIRIYFKDAKGQIIAQSNPDRNISMAGNLLNKLFKLTHQSPTNDVVSASWVIRGPDKTITVYISPDPASELNEAATSLFSSMLMLVALTATLYFGVKLTLAKALKPLKQSLSQLQHLAQNKYDGVLKESNISEVKAVNDAINELSQSLIALENSRQMLSAKLISSQEDERARVSRDIHDELGQKIAVIRYNTSYLEKILGSQSNSELFNDALQAIGDISDATKNIDEELKRILKELRPQGNLLNLNNESIKKLLIDLIEGWQATTSNACRFNYSIDLGPQPLQHNIGLTLFRVTQEALTNIAKHAQASFVDIQIHVDQNFIHWSVCDNGTGISDWDRKSQQRGNGLCGLQERLWAIGGELTITPKLEKGGFGLSAKLPLSTLS